jgi:Protein of unknown function (DUF3072)
LDAFTDISVMLFSRPAYQHPTTPQPLFKFAAPSFFGPVVADRDARTGKTGCEMPVMNCLCVLGMNVGARGRFRTRVRWLSTPAEVKDMTDHMQHAPRENPAKDTSEWVTGDEPMTGPQRSYVHTLAQEAGREVPDDMTKAAASELIDELQRQTGRGR